MCAVPTERRWLETLVRPGVRLVASGIGGAAATRRAEREVASGPPAALVSVGFCGALDRDLAVGDLVAAERVVDEATGEAFPADPALLARAPGRRGTILTTPRIVRTPAEKAAREGLACDMESAHIARAAAAAGVPFLALRAVTDDAGQTVPDFDLLTSAAGELSPMLAILRLVVHPADLGRLLRLWPASRRAGRALAGALRPVVGDAPA